jgi:hypothetical protein
VRAPAEIRERGVADGREESARGRSEVDEHAVRALDRDGDGAHEVLLEHLERDQLVAETRRPVPRAQLSARAAAGLWALRIAVVLLSVMVLYAFVERLA